MGGVTSICEFPASRASLCCVPCSVPWQCVSTDPDTPELPREQQGVRGHWGAEGLQGCLAALEWFHFMLWYTYMNMWFHCTHLVPVTTSTPGKEIPEVKPGSWNNLLACACSRQRCWSWPRHNNCKEHLSAPAVSLQAHNRHLKPHLYRRQQ